MLREFGGAGFVFVSECCLVVVESLFESTFGQADVVFSISVFADGCFVYQQYYVIFSRSIRLLCRTHRLKIFSIVRTSCSYFVVLRAPYGEVCRECF